jgi:hypothetical protein
MGLILLGRPTLGGETKNKGRLIWSHILYISRFFVCPGKETRSVEIAIQLRKPSGRINKHLRIEVRVSARLGSSLNEFHKHNFAIGAFLFDE